MGAPSVLRLKLMLAAVGYWVLLTALLPWYPLRMLWRSRSEPWYRRKMWQRFGLVSGGCDSLFHGVSVGEVQLLQPLIERRLDAAERVLLTTSTAGGRITAAALFGERLHCKWWPYDHPLCVWLFFKRLKPRCVVIAETEIWPAALWACERLGIPVYIVNGRLSDNSFGRYTAVKSWAQPWWASVTQVYARSANDAERFDRLAIGKCPSFAAGNMKYDRDFTLDSTALQALKAGLSVEKTLVFGSTHPSEEVLALHAFKQSGFARLVIVPRHINRVASIVETLQKIDPQLKIQICAKAQIAEQSTTAEVLVIDQFGESMYWYAVADVIVIGGSFINHGGQNPIEAVAQAKPVLMGPSVSNFTDDVQWLSQLAALRVVEAEDLGAAIAQAEVGFEAVDLRGHQGAVQAIEQGIWTASQ